MSLVYPAIFHPNADDGSITVTFPDIGCTTEGKDLPDAMYMARDALAMALDTLNMIGESLPPPSPRDAVHVDPGEYVTLVDADPEIYRRRRDARAVKRTLSLPEWLDTMASDAGLSLSKVLQEALQDRLGVKNVS